MAGACAGLDYVGIWRNMALSLPTDPFMSPDLSKL